MCVCVCVCVCVACAESTDFDRTLTSGKSQTCHGCIEAASIFGAEYRAKTKALLDHYLPIEFSPVIPAEQKIPHMIDWWTKAHHLFMDYGAHTMGLSCAQMPIAFYFCFFPLTVDHTYAHLVLVVEFDVHRYTMRTGMKRHHIEDCVRNAQLYLREGVGSLFDSLRHHNIPLCVMSAGLADVIEEVLRQVCCVNV